MSNNERGIFEGNDGEQDESPFAQSMRQRNMALRLTIRVVKEDKFLSQEDRAAIIAEAITVHTRESVTDALRLNGSLDTITRPMQAGEKIRVTEPMELHNN